jgi:hypothetical protein
MTNYDVLKEWIQQYLLHTVLFTFNDKTTRTGVSVVIENHIKLTEPDLKFMIVCDETNNTEDIVDKNGFVLDLYVAESTEPPTRAFAFRLISFSVNCNEVHIDDVIGNSGNTESNQAAGSQN